ncbi:hypothetical protein, partial [Bacteroides thetaiotaomicron]|uniref:hypothetical protein n=1 Tax=Bacteroides thetaiotaomicron TaxID=818 RepID=UPI0006DCED7D
GQKGQSYYGQRGEFCLAKRVKVEWLFHRSLILQNKDFYMDLINTAGDDAYELKKSLRNLIQKDSDPQLVKFVNSIDSVPEVETA